MRIIHASISAVCIAAAIVPAQNLPADTAVTPQATAKDLDFVVEDEQQPVVIEEETGHIAGSETDTVGSEVFMFDKKDSAYVSAAGPEQQRPSRPPCIGCKKRAHKERKLRTLQGYRSPKKAFLYSFLLPGFGQAYNKNYVRTGIYAAIDVAIIAASIALHAKGKQELEEAHEYADKHFSEAKFWQYYNDVADYLYIRSYSEYTVEDIQYDILWDATGFIESAKKKGNAYYSEIQRNALAHGWDDAEPHFSIDGFFLGDTSYTYVYRRYEDTCSNSYYYSCYETEAEQAGLLVWRIDKTTGDTAKNPVWGYSATQSHYNNLVHDANRKYRIAQNILPVLVLNHFVAATDALILAIVHNQSLEGRQSFLRRIRLKHHLALSAEGIKTQVGVSIGL
jgi:hypothetical protein